MLYNFQIAPLGKRIVAVDIAAHDQLPLVRLGNLEMRRTKGHHRIQAGFDRLADHGLEDVGLNGQAHPRHGRQLCRMSGHRQADPAAGNIPARGFQAGDAAPVPADTRNLAILNNINASLVRRPGIAPGHRVMARGAAATALLPPESARWGKYPVPARKRRPDRDRAIPHRYRSGAWHCPGGETLPTGPWNGPG